ncbi:MAG TPA: response regulator transcription factor [Desulfobacteraceae bacterium]|nr:response regulator transcription factor [Deltaproteobacteria bacterium]MBW2356019.1 response regulator transcription factor [Deltaproteobacteria bacterium]HDI59435.1 response regulator transcription factor [Desulfobacteraceae bacterium]
MRILLSSANRAVIKRWTGHLSATYRVESVSSVRELQARCARQEFELVLVHRALVDREGFSSLLDSCRGTRFFLLSDRPDEAEGLEFLKRGIVGYANAYIGRERMLEAIRTISNGSVWVGQKVIQLLIAEARKRAKERSPEDGERRQRLASLTPREQEIAKKVAEGLANLEIAADLNITERTVKAHLTSIYEKTGTASRLSLALLVNQG